MRSRDGTPGVFRLLVAAPLVCRHWRDPRLPVVPSIVQECEFLLGTRLDGSMISSWLVPIA